MENLGRWERLSKGQALGKKQVITVATQPAGGVAVSGTVDLIDIRTTGRGDEDACEMVVTLLPPTAILLSNLPGGVFPQDPQNLTTSYPYDTLYAAGVPGLPATEDFTAPPAIAIVEWGVGGAQARAEVDFSYGATINVQGSFLRVKGFIDVPTETFYPGMAVTLGAFVGPGNTGRSNAQRTYYISRLEDAADPVFFGYPTFGYGPNGYIAAAGPGPNPPGRRLYPIPPFAKTLWILGQDLAGVQPYAFDADLEYYRDIYSNKPIGNYHIGTENPGPIPVPNGAGYWTIHNNAATQKQVTASFDLSI
jgi:hypothetical protein